MTTLAQKPLNHGSHAAYKNHGCRCAICTEFQRQYVRDYRAKHPRRIDPTEKMHVQPRLPIAPLERILKQRGLTWGGFGGVSSVTLKDWRRNGVPAVSADHVAWRMGYHPFELYGQLWWNCDQPTQEVL